LDSLVEATSREPKRVPTWVTFPAAVFALVATLVCAAAIWAQVVDTFRHPTPIPPAPPPPRVTGVVWGGRVFLDVRSVRSALSARGVSYESWVQKHPAVKRILRAQARHR
jgi:hypothetical protein